MVSKLAPSLIDEIQKIVGEKNVLTDPGDLFAHSYDSALDRSLPSAVVVPSSISHIGPLVSLLYRHRQPYVARGAATSLCGGPVPTNGAVVIALAHLKKIGPIDKFKREVRVEPGVVNLKLQEAAAAAGLFFPPDPGSQKACTIGGNIATNAGGPHCLKYGVTSNSVAGLEVILAEGQAMNLSVDDAGYDLVGFLVGSEGTLGIVTRATLKLQPKPKHVRTMVVSFASIEDSIQSVTDIIGAGILPATLEAMDKTVVHAVEEFIHAGYPLEAEAVLLIEVDGDSEDELNTQADKIQDLCRQNKCGQIQFAKNESERQKLWEGRRGSYAAMARLAPNVLVEDGAVPRTKLPEALGRVKKIASDNNLQVALLFHAGDGNLHPQIIFDERDKQKTAVVKKAGYEMLKACVELGGTISGEHGIGTDKREAMKWLFSRETLSLFRRLKNALDPHHLCNADKLIPLVSKTFDDSKEEGQGREELRGVEIAEGAEAQSEDHLIQMIKRFAADHTRFGIQGGGSRFRVKENQIVRVDKINQIIEVDKGNLTLRAQAGATVSDARAAAEKEGRHLWIAGEGTLGGAIATKASVRPPLRDLILAMRVLLATGEVVEFGARTMKNVAGYDAAKLLIGSWGTLGIILDVTFRLFPTPPKELQHASQRPFALRDVHKKIKKAFDPFDILAPRTAMMTMEDIRNLTASSDEIQPDPNRPPSEFGDAFWR